MGIPMQTAWVISPERAGWIPSTRFVSALPRNGLQAMRSTRALCVVVALCGLAGSVRAQYYPAPQPYYNPYNPYNPYRPAYIPPPAYYPPQPGPVTYGPVLE